MHGKRSGIKTSRSVTVFSLIILMTALFVGMVPSVYAETQVLNRFDKTSDSRISASATHLIGFTYTDTLTPVGSINFEFCSNDPVSTSPCVAPSGFDLSAAILSNQTGEGGFTIHSSSTANNLILTRVPSPPIAGDSTYQLDNVINPNSLSTYYIRLRTFSSTDGTGTPIQTGGIALTTTEPFNVSTEVPPYLLFCAGVTIVNFDCSSANSFFIDLGELSTSQPKSASSEIVAATNAAYGYSITLSGTTLTSGNNVIPALAAQTPSVPGLSQFGINLRANTSPSIGADPNGPGTATVTGSYNAPNLFRYQDGDVVVTTANSNDYRKFTISYLTNINNSQPAGYYATTISFICLANF